MAYLVQHNFETLSSQITESNAIKRDLRVLLNRDFAVTSEKLDEACRGISALSDKIDALAPLVRTLGADAEGLSEQAMQILKIFEQTGSTRAVMLRDGHFFGLMPKAVNSALRSRHASSTTT